MASKKSTSTSTSRSTLKLTNLDKLALAAEVLGDDCPKTERLILDYAISLKKSPFMLRYLQSAIKDIVAQVENDKEDALALRIAELHFAAGASIAC